MDVIVKREREHRRAIALGRDIYAVSAPLAVEAATRILAGHARRTGTGTVGELFDATAFLDALDPEDITISRPDTTAGRCPIGHPSRHASRNFLQLTWPG